MGVSDRSAAALTLSLETPDAAVIDLGELRGRAVLVIAFDYDDLRSQATLREAELLARRHPDTLTVLALCGNPGPHQRLRALLGAFSSVLGLTATRIVLATDEIRAGTSSLGPIAHVPTTILVNRAGFVARTVVGLMDRGALEALVQPALPPTAQ
ncbi:MAG: hypothetical protein Q8Q09_23460 [Deltaproteobacteria bacterium]|nr:hypothetical protein [Deltaproteobacteria bacterium]